MSTSDKDQKILEENDGIISNLDSSLRPQHFNDYIGQESIKNNILYY